MAFLTTACADYDGGPLYRLEPPSDGWPAVVELEPDELYRFRLEVPPGTRGFSIYTEGPPGEPSGVSELFAPDGRMLIDGTFLLGDGARGPGRTGAAALSMPNHDIDVSEGGIWRVGAPGAEHVEVWSAAEVDAPARLVDVVAHMKEPFLEDDELETLVEEALGIVGLTLGRLEQRRTLDRVSIDIDDIDEDAALIPREDEPVLNVLLYEEIIGGAGASPVAGLPRGGSPVSALAMEYDATPHVLAHEIGHFVGLFHTIDVDGTDLLVSTPPCEPAVFEETPEQCPGVSNLMRRSAAEDRLTNEQRFVIESSMLWHP